MKVDYLVKVTECEPLPGYRLRVACSDGTQGVFDMSAYMDRGAFRLTNSPDAFNRVHLVAVAPTWTGSVDIAPERVRTDMVWNKT